MIKQWPIYYYPLTPLSAKLWLWMWIPSSYLTRSTAMSTLVTCHPTEVESISHFSVADRTPRPRQLTEKFIWVHSSRGLWLLRSERSSSKRSKHDRKSRELGAHILNLKQETKKELGVCRGALKARLQWSTSASWDLSPKLPQTALLARNQVYKYRSIWVHSYANQHKQYELNHSFSFRYFSRFFWTLLILFCYVLLLLY